MITMLARDLLDLPATKVLIKSKIRRKFDENVLKTELNPKGNKSMKLDSLIQIDISLFDIALRVDHLISWEGGLEDWWRVCKMTVLGTLLGFLY